jgi:hypothetical protein
MAQGRFLQYVSVEGTCLANFPFLRKTGLIDHHDVSVSACMNVHIFNWPISTKLGVYVLLDATLTSQLPTSINNSVQAETNELGENLAPLNVESSNDADPIPHQQNCITVFAT